MIFVVQASSALNLIAKSFAELWVLYAIILTIVIAGFMNKI
jgi:hypothetical protein